MTPYITVAEADSYFNARGNDKWPQLSQQQKEAAIVRATQYINALYVFEVEVPPYPDGLKHATAELALQSVTEDLVTGGNDTPIEKAQVGDLSVTYAVDQIGKTDSQMRQAYIAGLLAGIAHLRGSQSGTAIRLVNGV